jgi:predicted metal-binding transcription factor (methanogenesis marker protein 9)
MCHKCVRAVKNNPPKTVKPGLIRVLAYQSFTIRYCPIPLFWEKAANLAVEAEEYKLKKARTARYYTRKGRRREEIDY